MPYISIYIHFVWTTKNKFPFLNSPTIRLAVWKHIRKKAHEKGIHVDFVGGYHDHCHCLVSMKNTHSCDFLMETIKGESSRYINSIILPDSNFGWQDGYFAEAVPHYRINQVRDYIKNQEQHHSSIGFENEYEAMLNRLDTKNRIKHG